MVLQERSPVREWTRASTPTPPVKTVGDDKWWIIPPARNKGVARRAIAWPPDRSCDWERPNVPSIEYITDAAINCPTTDVGSHARGQAMTLCHATTPKGGE